MDTLFLHSLEFPRLLDLVAAHARSEPGRGSVRKIVPFGKTEEVVGRQRLIEEIMRMSSEGTPLKMSGFPDIAPLLAKARPEGAVLEAFELAGFIPVLDISETVSEQVRGREDLPSLEELIAGLTGFPEILRLLRRSVDSEGNILDSASALLSDLRERIRRLESRIRKRLEEMVRDERLSVFLQDDFITKRSGRWVVPVRMDSKGQVAGVVHDVSNSGETAFMEPLAIINIANELENLMAEQKAEEIRILRTISAKIRGAAEEIASEYAVIVHLDLLNAVAGFAESLRMEIPLVNESGGIILRGARHPLLMIALKKAGGPQAVPLDVSLGGDNTVMVITGSNAGGKTIAIKTLGLLLLMALSGMPVPASSASVFPLASRVLVDIGDEQSIESSLSTFSAHISNISAILRSAGPGSLVLIDELGTGTDPEEGAALACAVLKELRETGGLVFATTHLSDIKGFVHRSEGMLNASMEFDRKTLLPLYRLRIGEPGQSHALETARRYGLPDGIIDSAKAMLGGVKTEFDNLIDDLQRKREAYERGLEEIEREKRDLGEKLGLAGRKLAEAETLQKEARAKAYQEAAGIVLDAKRKMHALLEELKKSDRTRGREIIREVEEVQRDVSEKVREYEVAVGGPLPPGEIQEGGIVFVTSLGCDARVIKVNLKEQRVRVAAGNKEIEVPASDIAEGRGKSPAEQKGERPPAPEEAVSSRINLIGERVDEALSRLEPFLNHAALAGLADVTIIHGFGTGALGRAVREHLEGHPLIKKFRKGDKEEGGGGVTVATLK
jgi:DNA mismatch repair protein MutS2